MKLRVWKLDSTLPKRTLWHVSLRITYHQTLVKELLVGLSNIFASEKCRQTHQVTNTGGTGTDVWSWDPNKSYDILGKNT